MKKEELIAKGLSEKHAQLVIDIYTREMKGMIPKTRFDEINGLYKKAKKTIETLKQNNNDNLQNEIKKYSLKAKLIENGIIDADYIIYKYGGIDKFKFDNEGMPEEIDNFVEELKRTMPQMFRKNSIHYKTEGGIFVLEKIY